MSDFSIQYSKVMDESDRITRQVQNVRQMSTSVRNIYQVLSENSTSSMNRVCRTLLTIEKNILTEAVKMDSLSSALERAAQLYVNTENYLLKSDLERFVDKIDDFGKEIKDRFNAFAESFSEAMHDALIMLGIGTAQKQIRTYGEIVENAQEREMDLYMQQQIEEILKEERFSKKAWKNADINERKAIMEEYTIRVAQTLGLPDIPIHFLSFEPDNGEIINGFYSSKFDSITINEWIIDNKSANQSYKLMSTVVHELRHAYQHAAVNNPEQFVVTEETINSWQENINNYKTSTDFQAEGMGAWKAYQAYRNQTIEKDARSFAKQ